MLSFYTAQFAGIDKLVDGFRYQNINPHNQSSTASQDATKLQKHSCIFKLNDDVRQDELAIQIINLCQAIFNRLGLELWLKPYRVVSHRSASGGVGVVGTIGGMIECVPDCMSRHQLGKLLDCPLNVYFVQKSRIDITGTCLSLARAISSILTLVSCLTLHRVAT